MNKLKTIAQLAPIMLLALPLIGFGAAKLAGVPDMHAAFGTMGLPTWFGYAIGVAEVLGGIGLLIPRVSISAAAGVIPIMLGAIYFHLTYGVPSAVPAAVFVLLAGYTIYFRKKQAV